MNRAQREMKVVAVIQARMGSSRLPGKVMRELGGKPVLAHVIERVRACNLIDEVVVATTTANADDVIAAESQRMGAKVFRGSENDVLQRYADAARQARADVVVRVTSDCPLIDPTVLSEMLSHFLSEAAEGRGPDYLSNTVDRTFPRGLDAEIFRFAALERASVEATEPHQREHVTPYIWEHPQRFAIEQYKGEDDHSDLRWTLDTEADWRFLTAVFALLRDSGSDVTTATVLQLLDRHPELKSINVQVEQKQVRP
jgi:spore coat polysaccharide biosynthesis protein SpsF